MSPVKVVVLALLVGIGFWMALVATIWAEDLPGLVLNLGTEIMGAVAIYLILDQFIGGRERREAKKRELIRQMGSRVHDVAIEAVEQLRRHKWLYDGSLPDALLVEANLEGGRLRRAALQGVYMAGAHLQGANLWRANLQGPKGLEDAEVDGATTWPDGTKGKPATDRGRFTDPDHPQFYRSASLGPPAYHPKEQE